MLLIVTSCNVGHLPVPKPKSRLAAGVAQQLTSADRNQLQKIIDTGVDADLRWPDFTPNKTDVASFYEGPALRLAWVNNNQPTPQAIAYITMFRQAAEKGLDPEDYDASRWDARLSAVKGTTAGSDQVRFDVAMTVSLMRYARALNVGRLNPIDPAPGINLAGAIVPLATFLH